MGLRTISTALACCAALTGCAGSKGWRPAETYAALGHAPGWVLTIENGRLKFVTSSPKTVLESPTPLAEPTSLGRRYATDRLALEITNQPCNDVRSGIAFADTVTVLANGYSYRGCGGERVPLLDR
jgi:uncharacterized membrane protein